MQMDFIHISRGSPLRMRGKVSIVSKDYKSLGITPAYAGKSAENLESGKFKWDHPCVCGEKLLLIFLISMNKGSPLRMRGKVHYPQEQQDWSGITPAYAGKSTSQLVVTECDWDHPCVCGEKALRYGLRIDDVGSPLRMRGKVSLREL